MTYKQHDLPVNSVLVGSGVGLEVVSVSVGVEEVEASVEIIKVEDMYRDVYTVNFLVVHRFNFRCLDDEGSTLLTRVADMVRGRYDGFGRKLVITCCWYSNKLR